MYLKNFPAYNWTYGCVGTAAGMIMGYWDREGLPNIYTGTVNGGVAPSSSTGNYIYCLWASHKGHDGNTNWGHVDDYFGEYPKDYQTTYDPYVASGRVAHADNCIGDFIGANMYSWTNMNGECDGNLNAWAFNYFDTSGARRINFTPGSEAGLPARDIQSGLRSYAAYCGYGGESFSQLADVWEDTPTGTGFTFDDLVAEIDAGYPVLFLMQEHSYHNADGNNPALHGVVAVGYIVEGSTKKVRMRWGWNSNTSSWHVAEWSSNCWYGSYNWAYLRGVIGFHPRPLITTASWTGDTTTLHWDGPTSELCNYLDGAASTLHWYCVEAATSLTAGAFSQVTTTTTERVMTFTNAMENIQYLRIRHKSHPDECLHKANTKYSMTGQLAE